MVNDVMWCDVMCRRTMIGIETYASLLLKYASDPNTFSASELRENMDSWREVLFRHLDEEVEDLGWKRMREAGFTLEEIRAFPE